MSNIEQLCLRLETFLFACHRWYRLHAEHPQAAKVLSSSQTSCLAMAEQLGADCQDSLERVIWGRNVRDSQVDEIGSEREGCTARVWDTLRNQAISERVLGLAQIKAAHTTDKQVADGKAEEAP